MTKFWGTLFGINFVLGVATGLTMEFQFGMNWSYYSQYVGDIFGAPLAVEGLMAFFLEATFVGLFFFGWDKLSKRAHMIVTWLVAIGSNFSALWILIANGWMQNPVGAAIQPDDHAHGNDIFLRRGFQRGRTGQIRAYGFGRLCHGIGLRARRFGLVMLKGRHIELARRSIAVAASFGLPQRSPSSCWGTNSAIPSGHQQKMKLAAIEGMWETQPAPASFTLFGFPDQEARETHYAIHIPYVMGLIGTRSLTTEIPGIDELEKKSEDRIRSGIIAYDALIKIRAAKGEVTPDIKKTFEDHSADLGFALLVEALCR